MDRTLIFGGNPWGVIIRLVILSIVVGLVLDTLGISLGNLTQRINQLLRAIYDFGLRWVDVVLQYFLLGAVVVVPIWAVTRLFSVFGSGPKP
ncbi:MAG: DUF6460 domain-containing protein [Hyphomicrobium sp.]|nr:DUF6460 domain-containing protein [Hyphomicrobium sp.]